jgi:hypothetical protein
MVQITKKDGRFSLRLELWKSSRKWEGLVAMRLGIVEICILSGD